MSPTAAWQAFEVGPFRSMYGGYQRASWPVGVHAPAWLPDSFASLELGGYDGNTLTGTVKLYAAAGLDPAACAAEVLWDSRGHRGLRVEHPTSTQPAAGGQDAYWRFAAQIAPAPAIVSATAFVFCPINHAHRVPPWGADFSAIDQFAVGPRAKEEYCARVRAPRDRFTELSLAGLRTMEVGFACGVLPRLDGRVVTDDCTGAPLFSLDVLGPGATLSAPVPGAPLDDTQIRQYVGGYDECTRLTITGFDASAQAAWSAAIARAGTKITSVMSRDGMIEP